MTRKDFELIARCIRDARPLSPLENLSSQAGRNGVIGANAALDSAAQFLADAIGIEHPRFDRARFIQACRIK